MSDHLLSSSSPSLSGNTLPLEDVDAINASHLTPFERARAVLSSHLLQGNKVVPIVHNGTVYRLQATKLGKLILTK